MYKVDAMLQEIRQKLEEIWYDENLKETVSPPEVYHGGDEHPLDQAINDTEEV